ncbi:MAG: glycosyltransferase family 4 protein, partial [Patescibacteria group bacterium]
DEETVDSLSEKLVEFDKAIKNREFDHGKIKEYAQKFSKERFKTEFENFVREKWEEMQKKETAQN